MAGSLPRSLITFNSSSEDRAHDLGLLPPSPNLSFTVKAVATRGPVEESVPPPTKESAELDGNNSVKSDVHGHVPTGGLRVDGAGSFSPLNRLVTPFESRGSS